MLLNLQAGGPSIAVIDRPNEGILFGAEGLHIALSAADPKLAKCRWEGSYACVQGLSFPLIIQIFCLGLQDPTGSDKINKIIHFIGWV